MIISFFLSRDSSNCFHFFFYWFIGTTIFYELLFTIKTKLPITFEKGYMWVINTILIILSLTINTSGKKYIQGEEN